MDRAGRSGHPVGTRVRIANITDDYDADLNGRTGTLCEPFKMFLRNHIPIRDAGVALDATDLLPGELCHVQKHEFEVIDD